MGRTESATTVTRRLLLTWRGSERVRALETDITSHHLISGMHTCRNVGDTCTRLNFWAVSLHFGPLPTAA